MVCPNVRRCLRNGGEGCAGDILELSPRAAVVTAKTGAVRACDLTVEMALDAYEAADAGVKKIGEIAAGAASGASSAASGTAASPIAGSPLADVVAKTVEKGVDVNVLSSMTADSSASDPRFFSTWLMNSRVNCVRSFI